MSTPLHERLRDGPALFGAFALADAPIFVELLGEIGFDFVVIDLEHSETTPYGSSLVHMLRAADASGLRPWVRVKRNDPGDILTAIDAGAELVIVPHVRNSDDMERALQAASWPPRGRRGAAPVVRAARYGVAGWREYTSVSQTPCVVPLIEDPEGVDRIEEILGVDGVTAVWFGHFDLAVALGVADPFQEHPEVESARQRVHEAAGRRGVPVASFAWDAVHARALEVRGARIVAVSTDISIWAGALERLQSELGDPATSDPVRAPAPDRAPETTTNSPTEGGEHAGHGENR